MKQIVIINGSGGVGKDTFVDMVDSIMHSKRISSVDKVKEAAALLGWDGRKEEKDRKFLSDVKILSGSYSDHPYQYMSTSIYEFLKDKCHSILFLMIREPEEITRVRDTFGAFTLLIKNTNIPSINSNMADANVGAFVYDYIIDNSGSLEDLSDKAWDFVQYLERWERGRCGPFANQFKIKEKSVNKCYECHWYSSLLKRCILNIPCDYSNQFQMKEENKGIAPDCCICIYHSENVTDGSHCKHCEEWSEFRVINDIELEKEEEK